MGHAKNPSSFAPRGKWPVLLLRFLVVEHILFRGVKSEGTQAQTTGNNIPATAGLLCISECYTCPEICSPPPSPSQPKPPVLSPPVIMYSPSPPPPPQTYFYQSPPPPPQTFVYKSPPPLQRSPPSPPTPSQPYISWGSNPPPPPTVHAPPSGGNRNSTFPYYYFYASEANSVSPLSSLAGMALLSFSIVMVFWREGK